MTKKQKFKELNKLERGLFKYMDAVETAIYKANIALEDAQEAAEELIGLLDDEIRGENNERS
jgi:hypothetical protein